MSRPASGMIPSSGPTREITRLTIGAAEFKPMFSFAPYFGQDGYVSLSAPGESPTAPSSYSLSAQVSRGRSTSSGTPTPRA